MNLSRRQKSYLAIFILVAIAVSCFNGIFQYATQDTVEIVVTEKERIVDPETDESYYLIFTENETFKNVDAYWFLKTKSSDLYGRLTIGNTYNVKVVGWRISWLSQYRNIIRVVE